MNAAPDKALFSQAAAPNPVAKRGDARAVAIWLFIMCGLVALMVSVGGATRLTGSGLSITEWRPVTGAIPPLNDADWAMEFEKYRQIPQYAALNAGMEIRDFKTIYWWEWGHRFLGRVIGAAFLLPLIFFAATGRLPARLRAPLLGIFILGGAQGALGWWMVSSGLTERIDVSQYRLAAHLSLATLLFAAMFWIALDLIRAPRAERASLSGKLPLWPAAAALVVGVYLQMTLGAFVAGLKAGRIYTDWPLMDGKFLPEAYFQAEPRFLDLFETHAATQFNHRIGAYILLAGAVWFFIAARRTPVAGRASFLLAALIGQAALGVWTLVAVTPLALGLAHQFGALIVLSAAIYTAHGCGRSNLSSGTAAAGRGVRGSTGVPGA